MNFPMLPLPNKLGDPSGLYSHYRCDNTKMAPPRFIGSGCHNSGEEDLSSYLIHNVDTFPADPCKNCVESLTTLAPSDAIGLIDESIELIVEECLDPQAFEPTPLDPEHLHNNEQYRSSEVATNLMNLNWHILPITSYFLQPLSTQLDNDKRHTQRVIDPVNHKECQHHAADLPSSNNNITTMSDDGSSTDGGSSESDQEVHTPRFRVYQKEQWVERFQELQEFHKKHGHSQVPNTMKDNRPLARWVKRQRYQCRLRFDGKPSAMTQERITSLDNLGFIWDSRGIAWEDRLQNLYEFKALHKHCNVPSNYPPKPSLASWVKCQRRQYKLFREGKPSNITLDRIKQLQKIEFQWELRSGKIRRW